MQARLAGADLEADFQHVQRLAAEARQETGDGAGLRVLPSGQLHLGRVIAHHSGSTCRAQTYAIQSVRTSDVQQACEPTAPDHPPKHFCTAMSYNVPDKERK